MLFLDYEGTLVPFSASPELAAPDDALLALLARLARRRDVVVHLMSGAPRSLLDRWFGPLGVVLHAENGLFRRPRSGRRWIPSLPRVEQPRWLGPVADEMTRAVQIAPGSFIETKSATITWHYRLAEPEAVVRAHALLGRTIELICERYDLAVQDASYAFEVRPRAVDKACIVRDATKRIDETTFVLAAGDDATDEKVFEAVPRHGVSIFAGRGESRASRRVSGPREMRALLAQLCAPRRRTDILVVEDNVSMRNALLETLGAEGFAAVGAGNGAEALEWLRGAARLPRLVLTDVEMPVLDGPGLIAGLEADRALAEIPVVVMTASRWSPGGDAAIPVLRKPFSIAELVDTVRGALRPSRLGRR